MDNEKKLVAALLIILAVVAILMLNSGSDVDDSSVEGGDSVLEGDDSESELDADVYYVDEEGITYSENEDGAIAGLATASIKRSGSTNILIQGLSAGTSGSFYTKDVASAECSCPKSCDSCEDGGGSCLCINR